jgi:hypothetical protein
MIALGRNEKNTCACSFEVQGTVEVHLLVFRLLRQWGLLGLCPLRDKVGENLGLDGLSWAELKVKFTQLTDHLTMRPHSVTAMQDFSKREAGDDLDLVQLKVMSQHA